MIKYDFSTTIYMVHDIEFSEYSEYLLIRTEYQHKCFQLYKVDKFIQSRTVILYLV